jgi:hypothetical protein
MRFEVIAKTVAAGAVAVLMAGCGGGGGDGGTTSNVLLSGTAATGAALANATVDVKCAAGTGTATTNTTGGYTVTVTDGKLPCIIKVSGTNSNGVAVSLHSIADAGSASGSDVTATANVTPVTEMIVAQLLAALPGDAFANFNPQQVTAEALDKAADTIVAALKTAGIDLGTIDPLKDPLVPKTGSTAGNAYDVLLDNLAEKIGPEALPLVVSQIANAATTNSTEGLNNAIAAVAGGTLEGCASAVSGKYRVIDYTGATQVVQIDFSKMKVISGSDEITVTANSAQACEINVEDGNGTVVVFGPSGVGALRDNYTIGYVFPVQTLAFADIQSEWTFVESGKEESGAAVHFMGKIKFNADRSISLCEYDVAGGITSTCTPDTETGTVADGTDGGLVLNYGDAPAKFYGYRTPSGHLTLFGTNNPAGNTGSIMQTHFVAVKAGVATGMPTLNDVRPTWGLLMRTGTGGALFSAPLTRDTQTITKVDAATSTYTRVYQGSTTEDVFSVNKPVAGMLERTNRSPVYALVIPGAEMSVAINAPGNSFLYSTTVKRPAAP